MSQTHPPVFSSLARLLAPDVLARLAGGARTVDGVTREAIAGGLSGARIERVVLGAASGLAVSSAQGGASYILKVLDPRTNWLMRASGDRACREVRLTQSRLWELLPPEIWTPVLACALLADESGALVMADVSAELFVAERSYGSVDAALAERIVDGLAALHASSWEAADLGASDWLTSPDDALLALTPARLEGAGASYAAGALSRWSRLSELIGERDARAIHRVVEAPAHVLAALADAPKTLVHGDPWLANLGEHTGRLIMLDWGLCMAGPATCDSLWLANTWRALDADAVLAWHRAALTRRGIAAVEEDATWELLCDLGWLRTTLMGLEALVWDVVSPESPVPRAEALGRLQWWCGRAAETLARRGW